MNHVRRTWFCLELPRGEHAPMTFDPRIDCVSSNAVPILREISLLQMMQCYPRFLRCRLSALLPIFAAHARSANCIDLLIFAHRSNRQSQLGDDHFLRTWSSPN